MNTLLLELFQVTTRKNYEFQYKIIEEKNNQIVFDSENKVVFVFIGDPDCKKLPNQISELIKKLE